MRRLAEVAVIALLMAIPVEIKAQTIAGSSPMGKGLLSNCRVALQSGDKTKDGAVCIAFLQGFNFGYGFAQASRDFHSICVNGDVEMKVVVQWVVHFLEGQSEEKLRNTPASLLVMEALEEAYPCH
jgi:hypothetical protein